jgi:hypothetical protein
MRFEPVHRSRVRDRLRRAVSESGADSSRSRCTRFSLGAECAARFLRGVLGGALRFGGCSLGSRLRFLGGASGMSTEGEGDVADELESG